MAIINVKYQTYTNGRWLPNVTNLNDYAGIFGQPIQGIYASLNAGTIQYRVHTQNGSWLPWVSNRSDYAGVLGKNIDGLQMKVRGLSGYNVRYRAYVGGRWLPWVVGTSDYAGIYGLPIEAIQVEIISGGGSTNLNDILRYSNNTGLFEYCGVEIKAFDSKTNIGIISLSPITTVHGEISLTEKLSGPRTTINISGSADTIAKQLFTKIDDIGCQANFGTSSLAVSLTKLTYAKNIGKYLKYSVDVSTTGVVTITFEATLQGGSAVSYQRIIVTIYPRKNNGGSISPQTIEVPVGRNYLVYGLIAVGIIVALGAMVASGGSASGALWALLAV